MTTFLRRGGHYSDLHLCVIVDHTYESRMVFHNYSRLRQEKTTGTTWASKVLHTRICLAPASNPSQRGRDNW